MTDDIQYATAALRAGVSLLEGFGVTQGARIGMMREAIERLSMPMIEMQDDFLIKIETGETISWGEFKERQNVKAIGAGRRELLERLEAEVSDETMRALLSCKDVGSGRAHLARILAALSPASPARTPMGEPQVLKGVGKINGDGWKDTTSIGEVVYVWNAEKPSPYAPGQYPRIDNEGWSASTAQYDFSPASVDEVRALAAPTPMGGEVEALREATKREEVARIVELAIVRHGIEETALEGTLLDADAILKALAASSPFPAQGGEQIARKAELYDHMREVAAANGFDSLTQAIAEAYAARQAVSASPQPEAGEEDPSHHQVWTQERGWEHPTPPSVQPVEGK